MSMLVTRSDDGDSVYQERVDVPPLFAGPLREDLIVRIDAALLAGDYEKAAVSLHEADGIYPNDAAFPPLQLRCARLARRKAQFEAALHDALEELGEVRFASAVGKFRQALSLSQGHELFTLKVCETVVDTAEKQVNQHWRFVETLLSEMGSAVGHSLGKRNVWALIETSRREESVRLALEESGRAEHTAYLPHLRDRLAELAKTYPDVQSLNARLEILEGLVTQTVAEEREKNLRRLSLFKDRLDLTENPETLRSFADLVAPFVDPYHDDPAFLAILAEIRDLRSKYESAILLLDENRFQDAILICGQILNKRPANVLFTDLEEKAKSRERALRLINFAIQRARVFEEKAQYAEALEEWQALKESDPQLPGLDSEIFHCAALKQHAQLVRSVAPAPFVDEAALTPEIVDVVPESIEIVAVEEAAHVWQPLPPRSEAHSESLFPRGMKITITPGAWNHLKTGIAAAFAVVLVILVFASSAWH